ncbi:10886_t:CDS:1, partial [Acaulospora morrowiae]
SKYAIWDEGDNYIIENFEGEDIRVIPSSSIHHMDHGEGNNEGKRGSKINFFKKRLSKPDSPTKDMVEDGKNKENEKIRDAKENEEIKDEKAIKEEIKDDKAMEDIKEDKGKKKDDDETE